MFDGPIESCWVDELNTALDSTHSLCLTSGEIIHVAFGISVVLEALHLDEVTLQEGKQTLASGISVVQLSWLSELFTKVLYVENYISC